MNSMHPCRRATAYPPRLTLAIVAAATLSACSTASIAPDLPLADATRSTESTRDTAMVSALHAFLEVGRQCLLVPATHPSGAGACPADLWQRGRVMLELSCSRYLDSLAAASQSQSYVRKQTNLAGGLVSAALGLAEKAASTVAGAGAAFSFATASMDSFAEAYLYAPATTALTSIVNKAQAAYLTEAGTPADLPEAITMLVGYEELCRPRGLRRLVDEAVANAEPAVARQAAASGKSDATALLAAMSSVLGRPITEKQAILLYAHLYGDMDASRREGVVKVLAAATIVGGDGSMPKDQQAALKLLFQSYSVPIAGTPIRDRWSADLKALNTPASDGGQTPAPAGAAVPGAQPGTSAAPRDMPASRSRIIVQVRPPN